MSKWNGLPIVIFGCGGAAKEAKFIIDDINAWGNVNVFDFLGFVSENVSGAGIVCDDNGFYEFSRSCPVLGVVLPFEKPAIKRGILERLKSFPNIVFPNIIHPKTIIAKSEGTRLGKGVIISANVIIDPCVKIGDFVFINIASTIGHDSVLGDFTTVHISANIAGSCVIGEGCIIGANAAVKQGITVGIGAVCGMGAIVVDDVPEGATVVSGKAGSLR